MKGEMEHREVYLRYTDERGRTHVQCHMTWDASLFIGTVTKHYAEQKPPVKVDRVSRQQYREATWPKRT
jgi:hypothetical protein